MKFSKDLSEEDFDTSTKLRNELIEDDGQTADDLSKMKISTVEVFKKQFSFPEVAKNDFSTGLLDELEISQKNLNSNLENVDLFNSFVETADKVKKQLKEKYGDQWTDPLDGPVPSEDQEDWIDVNHFSKREWPESVKKIISKLFKKRIKTVKSRRPIAWGQARGSLGLLKKLISIWSTIIKY